MNASIRQYQQDVIHWVLYVDFHVLQNHLEHVLEVSWTPESRPLLCLPVLLKHVLQSIDSWIVVSVQVEAVTDFVGALIFWNATKAEASELLLVGVRLEDVSNLKYSALVVIEISIQFDVMSLSVGSCEVDSY